MIHLLQTILSETTLCGRFAPADACVFRAGANDNVCPDCRTAARSLFDFDIGCTLVLGVDLRLTERGEEASYRSD